MILIDASGLLAAIDRAEPEHEPCRSVLLSEPGRRLLSPFVLGEVDYLLGRELGLAMQLALLDQVARGVYELVPFAGGDVAEAMQVLERYADLGVGLADASIVVLADRYGTDRVLTLNERHFRVLQTLAGPPFTLLPADAAVT